VHFDSDFESDFANLKVIQADCGLELAVAHLDIDLGKGLIV